MPTTSSHKSTSQETSGSPVVKPSRRRRLKSATSFKRQTFYALEDVRKANLAGRIVGISLFLLIIVNALLIFAMADPLQDGENVFLSADPIGWIFRFSTVCFAVEYAARIWTADLLYGSLRPWKARLKYVTSLWGIIDLLAFLPNLLSWFVPMTSAVRNTINLLRLVRLIKISRYMRGLETIGRVIATRRHEIIASLLVLFLLICVSSVLMYEVEHPAQPDKFNSLLTGIYWGVTTVTSTGYGDITPITDVGRMLGSLIMLLGIGIVAIPSGILSAGFVAEYQNTSQHRIEHLVQSNRQAEEEQTAALNALRQTKSSSDISTDEDPEEDDKR